MPMRLQQAFADSYDVTPQWGCALFMKGCRVSGWRSVGLDHTTTWRNITVTADAVGWWDYGDNFVLGQLDTIHECVDGDFTAITQNPAELRRVL